MSGHSINITTCRHITFALSQSIFPTLLFLLALLHGFQDLPWAGIEPWLHQEILLTSCVQSLIPPNWSSTFFSPPDSWTESYPHASVLSRSIMSDSFWRPGLWPARLLCPWDSPGKNIEVGCHFFLQGSSWQVDYYFFLCLLFCF